MKEYSVVDRQVRLLAPDACAFSRVAGVTHGDRIGEIVTVHGVFTEFTTNVRGQTLHRRIPPHLHVAGDDDALILKWSERGTMWEFV